MQLTSRAKKFFYLSCLILLLAKAASIRSPQTSSSWRKARQSISNLFQHWQPQSQATDNSGASTSSQGTQPLAMGGGDPHVRALMRTITASEANVSRPYHVIYGGQYVEDLEKHPEMCVTIVTGPNLGNCTTAAGRYQMLDFTWSNTARKYHPRPSGFWRWKSYSFEAKYQDAVVHAWLSDSQAWGVDIPNLLRQGKITQVLKLLSGTWTSLGYGIETNSMSDRLPQIYRNMLSEELS